MTLTKEKILSMDFNALRKEILNLKDDKCHYYFFKNNINCIDCNDCTKCTNCEECNDCEDSHNCNLCDRCDYCHYCFGCVGLFEKKYHILNIKFSKKKYENFIEKLKKQGEKIC